MRIALLSPGPSLSCFPGPDTFDRIIAVNRAAIFAPCDFWSFGDAETYWNYLRDVKGMPLLWTHEESLRRIRQRNPEVTARTYQRDERKRWPVFSATAALMLAIELGATRIDCYGVDMIGELNHDGTTEPTSNRTEQRWERERQAWDSLARPGVEVVRHN